MRWLLQVRNGRKLRPHRHTQAHTHAELCRKGLGYIFPAMCSAGCWLMSWCEPLPVSCSLPGERVVCFYWEVRESSVFNCFPVVTLSTRNPNLKSHKNQLIHKFLHKKTSENGCVCDQTENSEAWPEGVCIEDKSVYCLSLYILMTVGRRKLLFSESQHQRSVVLCVWI